MQKDNNTLCYHIYGFTNCSYFSRAICASNEFISKYEKEHPNAKVSVTVKEVPRLKWKDEIDRVKQKSGIERNPHRTSPMVFEGCTALEMNRNFVGGYSDFLDTLQQQYQFHSSQC